MTTALARWTSVAIAAVGLLAAAATTASAQTKVRYVEVVRNLAYLPSYVAMSKGYFKEEGLDVELSSSQGGDKVTAMLLSGGSDIALVGPEVGIYVWNSESPEKMKMFAALTGTSTNFIVSRQKMAPADFNWSAIKGKKVLGWRPGSTPQLFLEFALRKNGIDPAKDIENITNVAVPARMGAWLSGNADFAIFSEPEVSVIERQGKGNAVTFVGNVVGKVDYTLFLATDTFIKKNPKVVQGFTNGIYKAQRLTASASPEELAKLVTEFFPGIPLDRVAEAISRYRAEGLWPADPMIYEKSIETLQEILIEGGVQKADKRVKYSDVVATTFAQTAKANIK